MERLKGLSIRVLVIYLIAFTVQAAAYSITYLHLHRGPEPHELVTFGLASALTATLLLAATPRRAI